jgi:hydroxyethylthiazole kinase-like uncharacterized protein yjeF
VYALSAAQMREVDRSTIAQGIASGQALMAAAARAAEQRLEAEFPSALAGRIAILCGGGNNGGDGLVLAARLHARGIDVLPLLFATPKRLKGEAAAAYAACQPRPTVVADAAAWQSRRDEVLASTLIVDALFGTGLFRPLDGWLRQVVLDLNQHFPGPVFALDLPSGLSADAVGLAESPDAAVLRATATVTFTAPKPGLYLSRHAAAAGRISVVPIGTPDAIIAAAGSCLRVASAAGCRPFLSPRPHAAFKNNFGHVLVVAGSLGKSGAAVLASTAALRMGAGLVTAAVPRDILPIVAAARPELMTQPLPESATGATPDSALEFTLAAMLRPATVLAVGPGLGTSPATRALVEATLAAARVPVVVDADGLNLFAGRVPDLRRMLAKTSATLTPHPGEMARLFGASTAEVESRRLYYVQRLAAETGAIALLKGHRTLVADPAGNAVINTSGNPGMATAGSGDVLCGFIAGLLAQFPVRPLDAAAAAVYLHGRAGDAAAARLGEMSLLAGDLIAALPRALRQVAAEAGS